ncbi:hypothetical protein [Terrimonas ferruginea]|uniref:hypothetical protein n=1 Tax=Terrimonas ferruginea TaxID=249 RepID=UPI0004912507|nr:hypothetical protein [Terrimonas ferruginea]
MKHKFIYILALLIIAIFGFRCTFSQKASAKIVIRKNYFDSTNFRLPDSDTNKFSPNLLDAVLKQIDKEDNAKCLLLETVSPQYPIRDYELYDYSSGNYYTANDGGEIVFRNVKDTLADSVSKVRLLKEQDTVGLGRHAKAVLTDAVRNDFSFFIVNFIVFDKKYITINSFYLQTLP